MTVLVAACNPLPDTLYARACKFFLFISLTLHAHANNRQTTERYSFAFSSMNAPKFILRLITRVSQPVIQNYALAALHRQAFGMAMCSELAQ
jgi:hypothetical protein